MPRKVSLIDAFVKGEAESEESAPKGQAGRPAPRPVRVEHQERKKVSFRIDPALHQRLKVASAVSQRDMEEIVNEALRLYLDGVFSASLLRVGNG
jgi:hypothetical protein